MDAQQKKVMNETDPSMLSQIASRSLAPYVFITYDFCLSHISKAKVMNYSGSVIIYSSSL